MRSLGSKGGVVIAAIFFIAIAMKPWQAVGQGGANVVTSVSAASFDKNAPVAPESIVAAFGTDLATTVVSATTQPLPTSLAGTTVKVKDSANTERPAQLFFVSPGQVNYIIPRDTATGVATITITNGDGKVSTGVTQIARAAPSLFTANASGQGIPAALALRIEPDGKQGFEPVSPLNLGPENEQVYLVLFGTGIRGRNALADITTQIGGEKTEVLFAEAQGGFAGLDQINIGPVPRKLIGRCKVNLALTINGFGSANLTEIEMAGTSGTSSSQISFNPPSILAGDILTINGAGFSSRPADNLVRIGCAEARVDSASPTQLNAYVPFGAETAPVSVRTSGGEGRGANPLMLRTSISGVVEDTARQPLLGVTVRVPGQQQTVRTNADGAFVFPDPLPQGSLGNSGLIVEIDGSTVIAPRPYPKVSLKLPTFAGRDNQFTGPISLQQIIGPGIPVGSSPTLSDGAPSFNRKTAVALAPNQTGRSGNIVFEIQPGTTARFPNGAMSGILNLTVVENQRTPVKLPPNIFSSVIVQITEFDVRLNPGGKLTFPNTDKLPAGTQATLYRLDQRRESPTLGEFIPSGPAVVSADEGRIETAPNAVTDTAIYFVAAPRPTTMVTGRVLDSDSATPVRQARVRCRGQEAFTDGNGGFTIRNVLVNQGDQLSVEASFQRSVLTGRVDRIQRDKIPAVANGVTAVGDLALPPDNSNRPPVILVPTDLTLAEGDTRNINFVAGDPDPGQRVVSVTFTPPYPFITLTQSTNDVWNLRLAPGSNAAGTYKQTLTATDNLGGQLTYDIRLQVNPPLVANPQPEVKLDEDTSKAIQLAGSDPGGLPLNYIVVTTPRHGRLSGTAPNLTYTPERDYNGSDSFSFRVSNGFSDSQPATVSIFINPINDAPVLSVPNAQVVDEGKKLGFTISASDVDANDTLTFSQANFPDGATLMQLNTKGAEFNWTPSYTQSGTYTVTFRVSDNGVPPLSAAQSVTITVNDINRPPVLTVPGPQSVKSCELLNFTVSASDPDIPGQTLTLSLDNPPPGATFDQASGRFSWTPAFLQFGRHELRFKVTDNGMLSDTKPVLIEVTGQWNQAGKLEGGSILALFSSGATALAGTEGGGAFRSTDNGRSWLPTSLKNSDVSSFAVIGSAFFAAAGDKGVLRSTDDGRTWTSVNQGLPGAPLVNSLGVNGQDLFVGTEFNGVYRSTDQGQNWVSKSSGLPSDKGIGAFVTYGTAIFVVAGGRVFRSTNNGDTWTPSGSGLSNLNVYTFVVSGSNIFAGTAGGGVFRSSDSGQNWNPVNTGLVGNVVRALTVSGTNLLAATDAGLYLSPDAGQSWASINASLPLNLLSLAFSSGNLFVGADGGGVFRSTNTGESWAAANNGLTAMIVNALTVSGQSVLAGTRGSGVYRSTDNGNSWTASNAGLPHPFMDVTSFAIIGTNLFMGTGKDGVFLSVNDGQTWEKRSTDLGDIRVRKLVVSGATLFAGTEGGGVFRSTNLGTSWSAANFGLTESEITAFAVRGAELYAGTLGGIFRSTDLGNTWTAFNTGLSGSALNCISFATRGTDLFASTYGGVFRLAGSGNIWTQTDEGLGGPGVSAFVAVDGGTTGLFDGIRIFAGSRRGIYYLPPNDGKPGNEQVWTAIGTGLITTHVQSFAVSGKRIFAGTLGGGVFVSCD